MDTGSLIEKNNGMFIIRQQMPYPLKENNAYLAEMDDGWAVIDLGIDIPQTRDLWRVALKTAGIPFHYIKKIIVTHCHPDHLGAAAWLQDMTGAPVYMSGIDRNIASTYVFLGENRHEAYEKAIRETASVNGFGDEKTIRLVNDWCDNVLPLFPEPRYVMTIDDGDEIVLNGDRYVMKVMPGHTDGQLVLWCRDRRTLFCGDIFAEKGYLHFTDWPNTSNDRPLDDFLRSLEQVEEMDPQIIYPGHGRPLSSYGEIISKLRIRHDRVLEMVRRAVGKPVTAGSLYERLFPVPQTGEFGDYIHYHRVLMGETTGYLNHLVDRGDITCVMEDNKIIYHPLRF